MCCSRDFHQLCGCVSSASYQVGTYIGNSSAESFPGPAQLSVACSTEKRFFVRARGNEATAYKLGLRFSSHRVPDSSIELGVPSLVPRPSYVQFLCAKTEEEGLEFLTSLVPRPCARSSLAVRNFKLGK